MNENEYYIEELRLGFLMECLIDLFWIDWIGMEVVIWENYGKYDLFE